jgi:tRNA(adenine34) deaminase
MKKALQEAEMAFDKGEIPLGLFVVNDRVIARSHNLTVTKRRYCSCRNASDYRGKLFGGKYLKVARFTLR